jgi:YrbI family 3-deoxy-D-manno-octulosonate 8-phosphate phosphatase
VTAWRHLAIIPARGGSRGIPRKNLQLVGGLPLVARTLRTATDSGVFATVAVTTDDLGIARVALDAGATLVMRPAPLARDTSPTEPAMAHALEELEDEDEPRYDSVWLLQATSPLLDAEDLQRARDLLESGDYDAVIGVYEGHPFSWKTDADGLLNPNYDLAARPRRQDLGTVYRENGALYGVLRQLWDREGLRVAGRVAPVPMPAWRSLDVDDPEDLLAADHLSSLLPRSPSTAAALARVRAIALDFDGVLTDNRVLVTEDGTEAVSCSRSDGLALSRLRTAGVMLSVFSTERNGVVRRRCEKLALRCRQDLEDKPAAVAEWLGELGISPRDSAFVGNDLNDLEAMGSVGTAIAPSDAHPQVRAAADVVLSHPGGHGALAELADLILGAHLV